MQAEDFEELYAKINDHQMSLTKLQADHLSWCAQQEQQSAKVCEALKATISFVQKDVRALRDQRNNDVRHLVSLKTEQQKQAKDFEEMHAKINNHQTSFTKFHEDVRADRDQHNNAIDEHVSSKTQHQKQAKHFEELHAKINNHHMSLTKFQTQHQKQTQELKGAIRFVQEDVRALRHLRKNDVMNMFSGRVESKSMPKVLRSCMQRSTAIKQVSPSSKQILGAHKKDKISAQRRS